MLGDHTCWEQARKGKILSLKIWNFFENLEICSLESYFLLGANKVNVWGLEKKISHLRICEICLLTISASGAW